MRNLSPAVLTIFLAGTALSQQPEPAAPLASVVLPPELDRVLRDYECAWQAHDPTALAELFSQDGFVLASGRPPVRGRAAIRAAYSGSGGPLSLRAFAYATADDLGYIIGGFGPKANGADSGKFILTLKRGADWRWLIMSDMDNPNQQRPWLPRPTPSATRSTPSPTPSR